MARVVHFEIVADDLDRATKFSTTVFGWKADRWGNERYVLLTTGPDGQPGINGGIMPRVKPFAKKGGFAAFICTVEGPEIKLKEMVEKVKAAGGKQVTDIQTIPGIGIHAYFEDTEGNIFGIMQSESP